ncbi:GNAT family N-acetyltransferase [Sinorhizobium sp. 8-89]|uniref:GNAT family N-acetyltransferase n=1 Tax=Sinorhizobium sp. 7-81 TaxID=3049087 RepID=UPI0024C351CB|nr:GNAT family N-acetyltransferase [Sinorhizobium sp. 7-81]MDK1390156.1 GNAT family N-acetyltransferase [Sinorhizobium sp. 7-81]
MAHPSLTTPRLVLSPYALTDVDELYRVMSDPRVMKHIGRGALTRVEVADVVSQAINEWSETGMGRWTIRLRSEDHLIGQIFLKPEKELAEIEVGYALDAAFWRQGYGREALDAVVTYGFKEKFLRRIVAITRPENLRSRALLERCRFIQEPDVVIRNKTLCLFARSEP